MGIKDKGTEITDIKNKSELILETKINAKPHPPERLNRRYLEKGACTITAVGDTRTLCCKIQLIHFTCMSACTTVS